MPILIDFSLSDVATISTATSWINDVRRYVGLDPYSATRTTEPTPQPCPTCGHTPCINQREEEEND